MVLYGENSYWLVKIILTKGLAFTYLIAFTVALRQYRGLVGEKRDSSSTGFCRGGEHLELPEPVPLFPFRQSNQFLGFNRHSFILRTHSEDTFNDLFTSCFSNMACNVVSLPFVR